MTASTNTIAVLTGDLVASTDLGAALAEANRLAREEERANDSDEATDDGLPPFNQHTFDEDD